MNIHNAKEFVTLFLPFHPKNVLTMTQSVMYTIATFAITIYLVTHGDAKAPIEQLGGYYLDSSIENYPELVESISIPNGDKVELPLGANEAPVVIEDKKPIVPVTFQGGAIWTFKVARAINEKTRAINPDIYIYAINYSQKIYWVDLVFKYQDEGSCNLGMEFFYNDLDDAYQTRTLGIISDYYYDGNRLNVKDECVRQSAGHSFTISIYNTDLLDTVKKLKKGIDVTKIKSILNKRGFDEFGKALTE